MWLLSQIREGINRGEKVGRKIGFHPHAFFKAVRRSLGGFQYNRLAKTLKRLKNTTVETTIRAKSQKIVMFS